MTIYYKIYKEFLPRRIEYSINIYIGQKKIIVIYFYHDQMSHKRLFQKKPIQFFLLVPRKILGIVILEDPKSAWYSEKGKLISKPNIPDLKKLLGKVSSANIFDDKIIKHFLNSL